MIGAVRLGLVALLATTTACRALFGFDEVSLAADEPTDAAVEIDAPCADEDGDGVCDVADLCAGFDDNADADNDGVPDGCDTWPCGPEPAAPANVVTYDEIQGANHITITLTDTTLDATASRLIVDPGQEVNVTARFSIIDCICPQCVDQIEIGIVPAITKNCLFNGNPALNMACTVPTTGMATRKLFAPNQPGRYDVRFMIGQDNTCDTTRSWFGGVEPGPEHTVAVICVRP